jgi:hypothetical protein
LGGRYCKAAISASRRLSRVVTIVAGSSDRTSESAIGSMNRTDGSLGSTPGERSVAGAPRPDGNARRPRCSSAVRHTFVAIRYSQTRTDDRSSNADHDRQARRYTSCTASSASCTDASIR